MGTLVDDTRLAYRVRTAEAADNDALRAAIKATLAHPDAQGRRESYRGAASRGDILVLERYERQEREWHIAAFLECHVRVDQTLTIRDIGTATEEPQAGVVRYLLDQAFDAYRPSSAQVKIRRDASVWLDILGAIPGFLREGEEYRRPHYWSIWQWEPQRAREASRLAEGDQRRSGPRPPARWPRPGSDRRAQAPTGERRPGGTSPTTRNGARPNPSQPTGQPSAGQRSSGQQPTQPGDGPRRPPGQQRGNDPRTGGSGSRGPAGSRPSGPRPPQRPPG